MKFLQDRLPAQDHVQRVTADCLKRLNSCSAGTALYLLSCLCPEDCNVVLQLARLDLDQPHAYKRAAQRKHSLFAISPKHLLTYLQAKMQAIPPQDRACFWLELTKGWLLTCPRDPAYDSPQEEDKDFYPRKLRSELVDRILNIS